MGRNVDVPYVDVRNKQVCRSHTCFGAKPTSVTSAICVEPIQTLAGLGMYVFFNVFLFLLLLVFYRSKNAFYNILYMCVLL